MKKEKEEKSRLTVVETDMSPELVKEVIKVAVAYSENLTNEQDICFKIKKELDNRISAPSPWHCIIGKDYTSFVTHEEGFHIQLQRGQTYYLIFRN